MGKLDGKVAIVTGAARGHSEAVARRFAEEGAAVAICDVVPVEVLGHKVRGRRKREIFCDFKLKFNRNCVKNQWKSIKTGTTIGNKRLIRFTTNDINAIRITILETKDIPVISEIGLYKSPILK